MVGERLHGLEMVHLILCCCAVILLEWSSCSVVQL